jgi:hypothetical protein
MIKNLNEKDYETLHDKLFELKTIEEEAYQKFDKTYNFSNKSIKSSFDYIRFKFFPPKSLKEALNKKG